MTIVEIGNTLNAMDLFAATFPPNESGEDLSMAAREFGETEKASVAAKADRLARFFN